MRSHSSGGYFAALSFHLLQAEDLWGSLPAAAWVSREEGSGDRKVARRFSGKLGSLCFYLIPLPSPSVLALSPLLLFRPDSDYYSLFSAQTYHF